jgi:RAD54-like protein 2
MFAITDAQSTAAKRNEVILTWKANGGTLIIGYETLRQVINANRSGEGPAAVEAVLCADLMVCDEGHRIKNEKSSVSKALSGVKTARRICLTGSPMQNNLEEYWCMVNFVRPNLLGSKAEFNNRFVRPIENGQCADSLADDIQLMRYRAHILHRLLHGFVHRRSHAIVQNQLPKKHELVLFVALTPLQQRLYQGFLGQAVRENGKRGLLESFAVLSKLWNHPDNLYEHVLRIANKGLSGGGPAGGPPQLSSGEADTGAKDDMEDISTVEADRGTLLWANDLLRPDIYAPHVVEESLKFQLAFALVNQAVIAGDKIAIFSQSLKTLDCFEYFLNNKLFRKAKWALGKQYYRIDGSVPPADRQRMIAKFNTKSNKVKLFLITTKAGGIGINLTGANRVIVFDSAWNPSHDSQAVCRVYRYGQTKQTYIYRLIAAGTMERKVYDRQLYKTSLANRVVDEMQQKRHLQVEELSELYKLATPPVMSFDRLKGSIGVTEDDVLAAALEDCPPVLTEEPLAHESFLLDNADEMLTKEERTAADAEYKQSLVKESEPTQYAAIGGAHMSGGAVSVQPGGSAALNQATPSSGLTPAQLAMHQQMEMQQTYQQELIAQVSSRAGVSREQAYQYLLQMGLLNSPHAGQQPPPQQQQQQQQQSTFLQSQPQHTPVPFQQQQHTPRMQQIEPQQQQQQQQQFSAAGVVSGHALHNAQQPHWGQTIESSSLEVQGGQQPNTGTAAPQVLGDGGGGSVAAQPHPPPAVALQATVMDTSAPGDTHSTALLID